MTTTVILDGARTPIGRLLGTLANFSAMELGSLAITEALRRSGVDPSSVDRVVMGQVITAGCGQNPARQAAVRAGVPMTVPALTINQVCLSGLATLTYADALIRAGEAELVVIGGMESMSQAPHIARGVRRGKKYGDVALEDSIAVDALTCAFDELGMGPATESYNQHHRISRAEQDEVAAASHSRAVAAQEKLAEEMIAVLGLHRDEGVRAETTLEVLAKLPPAFSSAGTITAGNASQLSDGAAALVVASKSAAERLGLAWRAEVLSTASVAGPDASLHLQPANAILAGCQTAGIEPSQLDLVEINEAFAQVSIASARKLGIALELVNESGGAIALGHPVGMSGARLPLHLVYELARRGGGLGAAALCGGGGQGEAVVLRVNGDR